LPFPIRKRQAFFYINPEVYTGSSAVLIFIWEAFFTAYTPASAKRIIIPFPTGAPPPMRLPETGLFPAFSPGSGCALRSENVDRLRTVIRNEYMIAFSCLTFFLLFMFDPFLG
jgi:hypothetical protein